MWRRRVKGQLSSFTPLKIARNRDVSSKYYRQHQCSKQESKYTTCCSCCSRNCCNSHQSFCCTQHHLQSCSSSSGTPLTGPPGSSSSVGLGRIVRGRTVRGNLELHLKEESLFVLGRIFLCDWGVGRGFGNLHLGERLKGCFWLNAFLTKISK